MKIIPIKRRNSRGYGLILVMVFIAIGLVILGATLNRTATTSGLNERNNQYVTTLSAAEAATEKILARMEVDYQSGNQLLVVKNMKSYATDVPNSAENSYWANFEFSDAQGHVNTTYITNTAPLKTIALPNKYSGLYGLAATYTIISNARMKNGLYNVTNAVQQNIALAEIPAYQFAIFYNGLMEFTWAAPMTVRGRVHSNNSIYTGSASPLEFEDPVTAHDDIIKTNWDGYTLKQMTGDITYDDGYTTGVNSLNLPIGTTNSADAVREIIQMPPSGGDTNAALAEERYYNKAQMVILVKNSGVTAWVKDANDQNGVYTTSNSIPSSQLSSFLSTTPTFTDQREGKTVKTTEIDVGKYTTWANANTIVNTTLGKGSDGKAAVPKILYVADMRTANRSSMTAVRLTDGLILPSNNGGLTVATPNPLYVQGNYNVGTTDSRYLNTTNTSKSAPASLISDALTVLSDNWDDSKSSLRLSVRADNTTVNAAIITGAVDSEGKNGDSPFSGGVMNLTRLLEDWGNGSSTKLTLNTSLVNLYNSIMATGQFQNPGYYYYAPIRDFNYDHNFDDVTKLPPGTPTFRVPIVVNWFSPPPNTVTYSGP